MTRSEFPNRCSAATILILPCVAAALAWAGRVLGEGCGRRGGLGEVDTIKDLIGIRLQKRRRVGLCRRRALSWAVGRGGLSRRGRGWCFYRRMQCRSSSHEEAGSRLICRQGFKNSSTHGPWLRLHWHG